MSSDQHVMSLLSKLRPKLLDTLWDDEVEVLYELLTFVAKKKKTTNMYATLHKLVADKLNNASITARTLRTKLIKYAVRDYF